MILSSKSRTFDGYDAKLQIVKNYIGRLSNATVQGSEGWLIKRAANIVNGDLVVAIGGSEIPTVIGKNKYQSVDDLVVRKVTFLTSGKPEVRDDPNMITRTEWGRICEPYAREFIEQRHGCDFFEIDESIIHPRNPHVRYSADGLGVIVINGQPHIVVLEIKNPYDRLANKPEIPEHYVPQVDTGLDVIEISEMGMYVECNYRVQSVRDFGRPVYNPRIHYKSSINGKKQQARFDGLEVHASALAFFYSRKLDGAADDARKNQLEALHGLCAGNEYEELIDFGSTNELTIGFLMGQINRGHLFHYKTESIDTDGDDKYARDVVNEHVESFKAWCESNNVIPYGVLPLSLFMYNIVLRKKTPMYIETVQDKIEAFTKRVHAEVQLAGGFHPDFMLHHSKKN